MSRFMKVNPWATGGLFTVMASFFIAFIHGLPMPPILDTQLWVMVGMWSGLRLLHFILSPRCRYSVHWFVQYGAMASYHLQLPLVFYAVHSVLSSPDCKGHHIILCYSLVLSVFVNISRHSSVSMLLLPKIEILDLNSRIRLCYLYCFWSLISKLEDGANELITTRLGFLLVHMVSVYSGASPTLWKYAFPWTSVTQEYAEYMMMECKSDSSFFDENDPSLSKCRYPFMHRSGKWIKVKDLKETMDRDICLSYSFFQLLRRRYHRFECAEEDNQKVRDFVLTWLLPKPESPGYSCERMFRIVEVQLALLHECFFASISNNFFSKAGSLQLDSFFLGHYPIFFMCAMALSTSHSIFAAVVLSIHTFIWWCQKQYILTSDRHALAVAYARKENIPSRWNTWFKQPYWQNKIGQYSLIEDYDRCSAKNAILAILKVSSAHCPVQKYYVTLKDSVRERVARTLQGINGPPTNGCWSLRKYKDSILLVLEDDLSWTLMQETNTHTIMIWHIATFCCDMIRLEEKENTSDDYEVATELSRYCAYLVAFLPDFLPDHNETTNKVLQSVLKEARTRMPMVGRHGAKETMSTEEKWRIIRTVRLADNNDSLTTFEKGIRLWQQVAKLGTRLRWRVMAVFWAETILYVASSDHVDAHIEHLAKGGQFVTHLWAILSNAGITKQKEEKQDPPPAPQAEVDAMPPPNGNKASSRNGNEASSPNGNGASWWVPLRDQIASFADVIVGPVYMWLLGLFSSILGTFKSFTWYWSSKVFLASFYMLLVLVLLVSVFYVCRKIFTMFLALVL